MDKNIVKITPLVIGGFMIFQYIRSRKSKATRYLCIEIGGTSFKTGIICFKKSPEFSYTISQELHDYTKSPLDLFDFIIRNYNPADYDKIAIASFGPVNLTEGSKYGLILNAPNERKKLWTESSLNNLLYEKYRKKVIVETDVNASAMGEFYFGNHNTKTSLAYITVGTGVGVGLIINNKVVHGFQHPEGGHTIVNILDEDREHKTSCLFHENCVEVK